jgi:hypothetical protein
MPAGSALQCPQPPRARLKPLLNESPAAEACRGSPPARLTVANAATELDVRTARGHPYLRGCWRQETFPHTGAFRWAIG